MKNRINLLEEIFDEKTVKIIIELLNNPGIFYLRDIAKVTNVSLATTYRIVQKLLKIKLVEKQKVGKLTQYIVKKGEKYNELYSLIYGKKLDPIESLKQKLNAEYSNSFSMFKTENNKIFIISEKPINLEPIQRQIEQQNNLKLNIMKIDKSQFKQMQQMGLIKKGTYI